MQVVQLDSKIKLLDSPGIVFASKTDGTFSDAAVALKNAVRTDSLSDPITPATAILHRANKSQVKMKNARGDIIMNFIVSYVVIEN